MPAAAVIPAPIAYINVVAVKKLVVGYLAFALTTRRFADECWRRGSIFRLVSIPLYWGVVHDPDRLL